MKKFIIGLVLGIIVSVSGSVYAIEIIRGKPNVQGANLLGTELTPILSVEEQIAKGHIFNQYTGEKLEREKSSTELRFQAIESRLSALEAMR